MAYVIPIADTSLDDHLHDLTMEQSYSMASNTDEDNARAIAISNWPEHGDYAFNNSRLFQPYWLQFEAPTKPVFFAFGAFVAIVGVLSVIGNGLVCFTFLRSPTLRKQKMFTINLCLSDFISPLLTYHMFVYSSYMGIWQFSYDACVFYAICQGFCGLMSIASLAAIAFERYARITNPQSEWAHMTVKRRLAVISFLWVYCAFVTTPPLYGLGKYAAAGFLNTCCFDYIDRSLSTRIFIMGLFALGLGVPMCVIVYCYIGIGLHVSRSNRNSARRATTTSESATLCAEPTSEVVVVDGNRAAEQRAKRRERVIQKELKIARLTLLIISVFIAAWVPYGAVALMGQFGPVGFVTPWMAMLPSVCAKSSTLYNPFLYAYKDVRLQRGIRKYILQHTSAQNEKSVSASATAAQSTKAPLASETEI